MAESEKKRIHRSVEERAAEYDEKIQKANDQIAALEEKKQAATAEFDGKIAAVKEKITALETAKAELLKPKPPKKTRKQKMEELIKQIQKSHMKPEELAAKLGLELSE